MRATFYGGPLDGGELAILEPIAAILRFPVEPALMAVMFAPISSGVNRGLMPNVPAVYQLAVADGEPARDTEGRIRYVYQVERKAPRP